MLHFYLYKLYNIKKNVLYPAVYINDKHNKHKTSETFIKKKPSKTDHLQSHKLFQSHI